MDDQNLRQRNLNLKADVVVTGDNTTVNNYYNVQNSVEQGRCNRMIDGNC